MAKQSREQKTTFKGKTPDVPGDNTKFNFGEPDGAQARLRGDSSWKPLISSPTSKE